VKTDSAFARTDRIVVLHAEAVENADEPVIHANRDTEVEFPQRPAQIFTHLLVKIELVGNLVKLLLCHLKGIGRGIHLFFLLKQKPAWQF
jgi:hypothetical protein